MGCLLRWLALAAFALWNAWELLNLAQWGMLDHFAGGDWDLLGSVDPAHPYATDWYKWSVPAAWTWRLVVVPLGAWLWAALHVAALALLPRRVALVGLVIFPFWWDLTNGNILTFVLVAAYLALAGNRAAIVAYVILAVVVPRPVMVPILAWLVWRRTEARWAFVAAIAVVGAVTVLTGNLEPWASHLLATAPHEMASRFNYLPSRWLGYWWLLVAWPMCAWAFVRGRLGAASILASPYTIPYYLVLLLIDLGPRGPLPPLRDRGR